MNSDDIIRMAREAGFVVDEKAQQHQPNCIFHTWHMIDEGLARFATLVAADERQFIINFLESMHERCLGRHNYYLHAAKLISNLPSAKPTK